MKRVMMSMVGAAMAIAAGGAFAVDDAAAHDSAGMNAGTYAQTGFDRGGVKVVFLGNSITLHGPCAKIGWTNNWGMAASAAEKDYVHLVAQGVAREFGRRADIVRIQNLCEWEKNYRTYDFSQLDDVVALKPDVLVVALGENTPHFTNEADQVAFRDSFKRLLGRFMENRDLKPLSVVRGCWWPSEGSRRKDEAMAHAASDFAIPFVKADLWGDPGMDASNGEFSHPGVQAHPGDRGMAEIANRILEGLFPTKSGYEATVDGTYARVRPIRVSAMEYNRWPKDWYQRPVDQTEVAGMVTVESDGATDWRVRAERKFSKAVVRPLSAGAKPVVADGEIRFTLPKPGHYTLELDDAHSPLQMFVEPKCDFAAERKAATISFGPGRHLAGVVRLKSHDRVFLDKDAFVYGSFAVDDAEDVMISGYGVICGTLGNRLSVDLALFADRNTTPIRARNSKRLRIDGPTIVDSVGWNISTFGCADVEIAHVKVTGAWRYNTDGIDICNCENVRLRDSFIHSFDDAVVLKGLLPYRALPERNIRVERCVCWCGWGGTLENGLETWASAWDGIVFEDCDLIHNSMSAMRLHLGGPCALGDVTYRNIRIEYDATERAPEGQASRDAKYSHRRDAPWTGNWLTVQNAKMYRPGSTYVNESVDPNEPCGAFRQLTLEDIDITVDDGVPHPTSWVCFEPGTALGRITAKGVRVNGVECPLEGAGKVRALRGEVGSRLDAMMRNNIERIDWGYLDFPFTQKTETGSWKVIQPGIWQTEFWGKLMHAAVPLALYAGDEALKARIGESVKRVLATQQADGYIGNYRPENRGTVCDVWGVKYVMMGLLHWFDATGDKTALDGAARLADWLMSVAGPGKISLGATGPFGGLMNCSVLEPVVWLYRRIRLRQDFGGQARAWKYLEYAKWIVSELDTNAKGPELIPLSLKGVSVRERHPERDGHKAYEMMSCCQGLLDYYEETGDRRILEAVVRSAENIVADEIDICGGGTRGERFAGTAKAQTTDGFRGSETCVLITWMRLCEKLCEVTGEPRWADELERTFFNAYLGQLARDGSTFASYEGLAGVRERRHPLQCRMEANCCSANGPRGFLSFMGSAASAKGDVITVNQYVFGHVDVPCTAVNGGNIRLDSFTEYPRVMRYAVTLAFRDPAEFTLRFRAPAWSAKTAVRTSSGEMAESKGGEYISLRRLWKPGDQIEVTFDDRVVPHHLNGFVAFTRGPLALARDIRFADGDLAEAVCGKELRFEEKLPPDAAMYMSVGGKISLCDYASAGNTKDGKSTYRVWLPEKERGLVAPRIDCEFCSQDDLDAAVETLEMCYLREPKFGLVRPFFKPGACPSGVNDYGGKWWSLDYALAVEGAKWLDFGIGEDLVTNLCAVICPDGRMKLYSADWKKCVDGKDVHASSLPKFHETVYAVARMSARREVREQALSLLERNLAWWFRERQDPETKLVTAMFEETFVPNTDSGPGVYAPLDTNLEIAIGAQNAAALAELLGRPEKAKVFRVKADEILAAVARYCHEPADGRFRPYLVREKRRVPTDLASMFLAFRLPGFGRNARLLSVLRGEEFGWDAVPLCSASRKDPRFNAHDGDYRGNPSWLGGVWTLHNDAVIRALRAGGDDETATALALKTVRAFRGKPAEFLNPDTGRGNGMLRYAWTASQFIRIVFEELFGLSYTPESGLVCKPASGFTGSLHGLRIPEGRVANIDVRKGVAEISYPSWEKGRILVGVTTNPVHVSTLDLADPRRRQNQFLPKTVPDANDFRFDADGTFTFFHLSDFHRNRFEMTERERTFFARVYAAYRPKLAVVTGDNSNLRCRGLFESAVTPLVKLFTDRELPFAITFGNHDTEYVGEGYYTAGEQWGFFAKAGGRFFVDRHDPSVPGGGVQAIDVRDGSGAVRFRLAVVDSGDYGPQGSGFDSVRAPSVAWARRILGDGIPTLFFQHIVVPETRERFGRGLFRAAKDGEKGVKEAYWDVPYVVDERRAVGEIREGMGSVALAESRNPAYLSEGESIYDVWRRMPNFRGAYFGHDHVNSVDGTTTDGVRLGLTKTSSECAYNDGVLALRVIRLHADGTYETFMATENQMK